MDLAHRGASLQKGEWGRLLILAGSIQFAGAAVLTTRAALRTGLDIVVLAAPERAANAALHAAPDAITLAVPARHFEKSHLKYLSHFKSYPVAVGSGLMVNAGVGKFLKSVLSDFKGPFVLDADALRIIAGEKSAAKLWKNKQVILTPNRAEYGMLAGEKQPHPLNSIKAIAQKYRATILCKGRTDVISDGERIEEISGGTSYLAKAGTGDVLTGIVGAIVSRGVPPFDACVAAARLLKQTGTELERSKGPALLASDIIEHLDLRKLKGEQHTHHHGQSKKAPKEPTKVTVEPG